MWYLADGIQLVAALQPATRKFGYHVTIGGGVVNNGYSEKDLDLFFLPMGGFNADEDESDPNGMLNYLEGIWGNSTPIKKEYFLEVEDMLYQAAVKFFIGKQRIDVFIF